MTSLLADLLRTQTGRAVAGGCIAAFACAQLHAVVYRHDRSDAEALELGRRFVAAGRIVPDGGCTLIAPTWAITAAHVAERLRPGGRVEFGGQPYPVTRVVLHPEGQAPAGRPPEVDLALIELAKSVTGVEPLPLYSGRAEVGKMVYVVGYGDFGPAGARFQRTDGRRRAVTNLVEDAGPRRLFLKFDEPPGGLEAEGVGGPGDSGGPAILDEGGSLFLAGVSSASMNGKAGTYGVTDVYTRVGSYRAWIEGVMAGRL